MREYELAVMNVKATLFDIVYHEQGLLDILSKMNNDLTPEKVASLTTLYTKQGEDIKKTLDLLAQFDTSMKDILKTSAQIVELTNGGEHVVSDNVSMVGSVSSVEGNVVGDTQQSEVVPVVTGESNETQNIVSTDQKNDGQQVVACSNESVANESPVLAPLAEENNDLNSAVSSLPLASETQTLPEAIMNPTVPITEQSSVIDSTVPVATSGQEAVTQSSTPINEVIQVSSQTSALDDNDEKDNVTSGFVLSPIDDGVLPAPTESQTAMTPEEGVAAANQQLQTVENVKQEIINNSQLTDEAKKNAIEKYTRVTADVVKAILVTKAQYEKLAASRQSQQVLINAKSNNGGESVQENSASLQQPLVTSNMLTSDVQDKQKEMEIMMNQANSLYKEGKTQEAQEIYTRISDMNKAIQSTSPAVELVKK